MHDFKNCYQLKTNLVKDEKGDLPADPHSLLYRRKNNIFCQLLNIHGINDVGQTGIHTAEPLAPECTAFDDDMAIKQLKK
jgi:hypothetical protein